MHNVDRYITERIKTLHNVDRYFIRCVQTLRNVAKTINGID